MSFIESHFVTIIRLVIFVIVILLGCVAGANLPIGKSWQREAVLKGHAIWAVDKDGAPVFQWKSEGAKK